MELYTEISSQNIKPCLDIMINYVKKVVSQGFSQYQFDKELEKDEYYWQTRVNSPDRVRGKLTNYRFYGKFLTDKMIHDAVQSLTLEEVNAAAKELFENAQVQIFVYGNASKNDVYTINQIQKKFQR